MTNIFQEAVKLIEGGAKPDYTTILGYAGTLHYYSNQASYPTIAQQLGVKDIATDLGFIGLVESNLISIEFPIKEGYILKVPRIGENDPETIELEPSFKPSNVSKLEWIVRLMGGKVNVDKPTYDCVEIAPTLLNRLAYPWTGFAYPISFYPNGTVIVERRHLKKVGVKEAINLGLKYLYGFPSKTGTRLQPTDVLALPPAFNR